MTTRVRLEDEITTAGVPSDRFDVITFWDSFEHLPNPRAVLEEARRVLRPGGLVLIGLPNFGSYQAEHFGQDWYSLSLPYHFFHYTAESLTRLLESCGFRIRAIENRRVGGYHAMKHSLLARMTRRFGPRAGRLAYYLAKPLLRPWEWTSSRPRRGAALQICAEMVPGEAGSGPT